MPVKLVPSTDPTPSEKIRQRLKASKPDVVLQCRCGGRDLIEVKSGMLFRNGKAMGGTKQYLCVHCLQRGERVVIA